MSEEEIKRLKQEEQEKGGQADESGAQPKDTRPRRRRKKRPNLFGPLLLIGVGLYFLLVNLGVVDGSLHWGVLFSWWPLFLIFVGLQIITQQLPGVLGGLAEGLLNLTAVVVFGSLLVLGNQTPILGSYARPTPEIQATAVDLPLPTGASAAEINIDFNAAPALMEALPARTDALLRGTVYALGNVEIEQNGRGDVVTLRPESEWQWSREEVTYTAVHQWQLGLSPDQPLNLNLDLGAGAARLDLSGLQIEKLEIDGGSGATTLTMPPGGDYDLTYDVGSGAVWMTFPVQGRHRFEIEGGSGGVNIILPDQIEARVTVESGNGSLTLSERFHEEQTRKSSQSYVTPGFNLDSGNYIDLYLDMGSGSVSISADVGE